MVDRSKVKKNVVFQYGLQIARYVFPFITVPYLTRVLGPDVYAVRAYVLAVMTLLMTLLDYGFTAYGTKTISENRRNITRICQTIGEIALLRLALCFVGALLLLVVVLFIPLLADNVTFVFISYACICCKSMLPDFVFQGLEDMGIITYRYVVTQALSILLILCLVRSPSQLILVAVIECTTAFLGLAWSWGNVFITRKMHPAGVDFKGIVSSFKASTLYFIAGSAASTYNSLTTVLIGIYIDSPEQVSYWSIAVTAVTAVQMLYTPICNSVFPHMCARRDFSLIRRLLLFGVPVVLAGTIVFAILSETVVLVIGGEEYLQGASVVAALSPVLFFSYPAILLGTPVLAAIGEVKKMTITSVIAASFNIAGLGLLLLAGRFSIMAVALLRSATEAVLFAGRALFVYSFFSKQKEDLPEEFMTGDGRDVLGERNDR